MQLSLNNELTLLRDKILEFVLNCQKIFGLSDELMAHQLQLSPKDFHSFKHDKEDLSISKFEEFLKKLNVSAVNVFKGTVDYDQIFHHFYGDMSYLQTRYSLGASGRKRTVINILEYIEKTKGKLEKLRVLRRFQMSPYQFLNPDELINNNFIVDLFDQLLIDGYSLEDIVKMGEYSYESNKESLFGTTMRKQRSRKELIEFTFKEVIGLYDCNFDYELTSIRNGTAIVKVIQNKDVAEEMKKVKIGSFPLSVSKLGVIGSLPRYLGQKDFCVQLKKTSYSGEGHCEYEILY